MNSALVDTYAQLPIKAVKGDGVSIIDNTGKRYLDLYGGHAVSLLGHTPTAVTKAITAQAEKLFFYSNVLPLEEREVVARELVNFAGVPDWKVFFCNSGAEANENALKLAIKKTGRKKIIGFKGSFHGRTLLAASVTDHPDWHQMLGSWVENASLIPINDTSALSQITEETAAVILEPIQSMNGLTEFKRDYLASLRAHCDKVGALLIFDEVQTGMGRTGVPFMNGNVGIFADMVTTAKGLGSGFPVGVLLMNQKLSASIKSGDLGSTFGGGPLAMAAIGATLAEIKIKNLVEKIRIWGEDVKTRAQKINGVKSLRGSGALIGIEFAVEAKSIQAKLLEKGIITGTSGDKHVLRLLPPLIVERAHADAFIQALSEIQGEVLA